MDIKQIRYLEKIAADGHKALEIAEYHDWELRFSKGYTGRANSIRLMGDPIEEINKDVEDKIRYAEEEYAKRGLPLMFKLTDADKTFSDYLESHGYKVKNPTDVMSLPLNGADYLIKVSDNIDEIVKSVVTVPGMDDALAIVDSNDSAFNSLAMLRKLNHPIEYIIDPMYAAAPVPIEPTIFTCENIDVSSPWLDIETLQKMFTPE